MTRRLAVLALAVLAVSGWGFVVWIYQLFAGPPTY